MDNSNNNDEFKKRINDGLNGDYVGLKNGFNRLNKYLYGLQRRYYYLLGGLSGAGKTTLGNYMLLNALKDADEQNIPIHVFYYSYEIDEESTKANWLSTLIYQKYRKIVPPEAILGLGDNRLNSDQLKLVDLELPYLNHLFTKIKFKFEPDNPTGIRNELITHAQTVGDFQYEYYTDSEGQERKKISGYKLHNPKCYNIVVMDHMALMKTERGFTLKDNIDKYSSYCIWLRNICGFTFINIQQFNQGLNTVDRAKFKGVDLSPQQNDFKDTTNTYADSNCAIGVMNPHKMDMEVSLGYDLKILKDGFRMVKIIKNRMGGDNKSIGTWFNPVAGSFHELPIVGTNDLNLFYNQVIERNRQNQNRQE